jgi:hypothetical protein
MKVNVDLFVLSTRRGVDRIHQYATQLGKRESVSAVTVKTAQAPDNITKQHDAIGANVWLTKLTFTFTSKDEMKDETISTWALRGINTALTGLNVYDAQAVIRR